MPQTRFVRKCYDMMLNDDTNGHTNWVTSVKVCLQRTGFGYVWPNQTVISEHIFLKHFVNKLKACYLQTWNTSITSN